MDKSIALIGGGGFVGTNLTNFFIEEDYNVLVIGRSVIEDIPNSTNKIKKRLLDVNKTSKLIEALAEYENIVWLVNDLVPSASMDSLVDEFTFNLNPLIHFLESVNRLGNLKHFCMEKFGRDDVENLVAEGKFEITQNWEDKNFNIYCIYYYKK